MLFLVDEDVPLSAAELLATRGHQLRMATEVLLPGSPDALVARWAEESGATILTCNGKHFIRLLARAARDGQRRYRRAGLVVIPQVRARERLADFVDLIELESDRSQRVLIEIRDTAMRVMR